MTDDSIARTSNAKRFPADEAIHHTGQRGPMVVLASDHDAETERLQRDLALRNEQIDGYERQLGIDKAGAEHTIGSEIERLRGEAEVAGEQLAQLRGFAEAHKTCRGSDETCEQPPPNRNHDKDCPCYECANLRMCRVCGRTGDVHHDGCSQKAGEHRHGAAQDFVEYDPEGGVRIDMARYLRSPAGQAQLQELDGQNANSCVCGEPNSPGTHRTDGPCLAPMGDPR